MDVAKILVIEDDEIVARTVQRSLQSEQWQVTRACNGVQGLEIAHQEKPDLVILDVIMPGMDGYEVCRALRSDLELADLPVLFLTAKIKEVDRITGFQAGGDDYLCKPFNLDELILRVRAILRRTRPSPSAIQDDSAQASQAVPSENEQSLAVGDFLLNTRTFELQTPDHGKIRLTPVQFDLLYHLMTHAGEVFSPGRLLDEVWDYPSGQGSPDLVRVHIKMLRERIEQDPRKPAFICTVPGSGYTIPVCEEVRAE
jgi:DNA-binding response OmpR family regulator